MSVTVDERKKLFREQRGLQRRIAKRARVSPNHISLVVRGERVGSEKVKRAIARGLGLPVEQVFPLEVA